MKMRENRKDEFVFETQDPLNYDVKLKKGTWESHIIGDHAEREDFRGNEHFFKSLVEDPDYIYKQKTLSGKARWNYIAYANIKDEGNPKVYSIIAEHHESGYRDIVTIFPKNSTKLNSSDDKSKEGKVYDRRKNNKNKLQ